MKTQRKYNKKNIKKIQKNNTRKNNKKPFFSESILNVYNKNDSKTNNERNLACFLSNNDIIKHFGFKVFYFMLQYWKYNTHNKWLSIIKKSLIENFDKNNILEIGFSQNEITKIAQLINDNDKKSFFIFLDDKFLKVTSVLNRLSEPHYTFYHVDFNKKLQNIFIHNLKKNMFIQYIEWKDIKNMYNSTKNEKERNLYSIFIFDLIYSFDKSVTSIYRANLGNMNFFRERLNEINYSKSSHTKLNECNKSIVSDDDYSKYEIYNSSKKYKINSSIPYYKIMNKYQQNLLAGPSSSTVVMFITLFHFYMFPFTYKNKILLFGLIIADYVPLWHTIPEIILGAYPEFKDDKIPRYTLETDAIIYSINLLKKFIQ